MTVFILVVILLLVIFLQRFTLKKSLESFEEDYGVSPGTAEPGQEIDFILTFRNKTRRFVPYFRYHTMLPEGFALADGSASMPDELKWNHRETVHGTSWLAPRQKYERRVRIVAPGRGRYPFKELSVYGGDFLGLRETFRGVAKVRELVVYPKEADMPTLDDVMGGFLGDLSVRRFIYEDPVLTLGYRDYTGREPMKTISWIQSARRGALTVKNYDHTTEPSVSVILDVSGGDNELSERCFEIARAVCARLEKQGAKYDFSMNAAMAGSMRVDCRIPEGMGSRHFYGIMECLGRATYDVLFPVKKLVEERVRYASAHGVILIVPRKDAGAEAVAAAAQRSGCSVLTLAAKEMM
ncbi:MAG: DUF58 domain-containing protein [Oscillospiraceae bacterium]|nr:DUF58 domain-containing protein [Oscillospiraceae bacterium]